MHTRILPNLGKKDRAWVRSRMTEVILRSVCEELSPNREKWSICLIVKV